MTADPVPSRARAPASGPLGPALGGLVEEFLRGRAPSTLRTYAKSLAGFAEHVGAATVPGAARLLLADGPGPANRLVLGYRAALVEAGLAPNSVNVRLSAVRSLVAFANLAGLVPWSLSVRGVRAAPYRDVRGPGRAAVRRMLQETSEGTTPKALRDRALLRALVDLALRRGEAVSLDLEHLDLAAGTLLVRGKGHRERVPLTLPEPTRAALAAWTAVRGDAPGPLFPACLRGGTLRRAADGSLRRIAGADVYRLVRAVSERAGVGRVRPHGLRHSAITMALDLCDGDVRRVQRFSRHASLQVLLRYDDARQDDAGDVARLVAATVGG